MDTLLQGIAADPVFGETDAAYLVIDRDLVIRAVNSAYLGATGRERDELLGRYVFDAFPDNPADPDADGVRTLQASFESVLRHHSRDRLHIQRYDVPGRTPGDDFVLKYWAPVNSPLRDERGRAVGALHHVDDVTAVWTRALRLQEEGLSGESAVSGDDNLSRCVRAFAHEDLVGARATTEVGQLREALTSRVLIEQAKGVLVARHGCDPDTAFTWPRRRARSTRANLHEVCAEVVSEAYRVGADRPETE
jgi:PAS domain S-box-containing protein